MVRVTPSITGEDETQRQCVDRVSANDKDGPTNQGHGLITAADGERAVAMMSRLDDFVWLKCSTMALRDYGPLEFQRIVKERWAGPTPSLELLVGDRLPLLNRYLLDCSVWGVSAALFATIGVSFLLLGPTNYKADDVGKRWQQVREMRGRQGISTHVGFLRTAPKTATRGRLL